ncbi:ATP-binding cassette domain-containing protein [Lactovum miscens]|uniref:ABC-2 type transport system ATP-binding protein n=1 Tax=Lactovum miscens TaxID=190387 RepID=A0A841C8E2_9LACT|nr:ABC-2 type transport system ATP-binding protein [Lactovum miscens]
MTEEIAVKVSHVSKFFRLPTEATNSLRSKMINSLKGVKGYKQQYVLKDINFTVNKGDFFGIVGRNGSGKSTLLKIISQIYVPETGNVEVSGKLVSFIELGVGFNPELTGRENVYLNGAMLGFSTGEIDGMYDEIVEFAELGEFMNQKLKNYSSGMQVRLAFSVAIKAKGDVLVLDEVLAVGDEAFQRKCDNFFKEIKEDKTKTIILVTHDMNSVKKYCNKAVLIKDGLITINGSPNDVANEYIKENFSTHKNESGNENSFGVSPSIPILDIKANSPIILKNMENCSFSIEFESKEKKNLKLELRVSDDVSSALITRRVKEIEAFGKQSINYILPISILNNIQFNVKVTITDKDTEEILAYTTEEKALHFKIDNSANKGKGLLSPSEAVSGDWS